MIGGSKSFVVFVCRPDRQDHSSKTGAKESGEDS